MTDTKPSDTPRTDALLNPLTGIKPTIYVVFEHARQLERELTRIHSAEMPEPVAIVGEMGGINPTTHGCITLMVGDKIYGPELLAYAKRKEAEARSDEWMRDLGRPTETALEIELNRRAEALAAENAKLKAKNEGLRKDGGLNMHDPEGQKYAGFPNDDALAAFKEQP